jgi:hypothetical protein
MDRSTWDRDADVAVGTSDDAARRRGWPYWKRRASTSAHREEVILAVGNRLSGLGVDLSANLRRQLADARTGARRG